MDVALEDVQKTALIPLVIRALETERDNARIVDQRAVEITQALNVDCQKYDAFLSHEGVVARTILIDEAVRSFVAKHPHAVCVNMGCGLDNRFERVDNGTIDWYDVDLPSSIAVRREIYKDTDRRRMMAADVLAGDWLDGIASDRPTLFIAEGLFMYFEKDEIARILRSITSAVEPGCLVVELMSPAVVGKQKHHDTVGTTGAVFRYGAKSGHEFEELCPRLSLVKETSLNDLAKHWSVRGRLFATLFPNLNNRIAVYKWGN